MRKVSSYEAVNGSTPLELQSKVMSSLEGPRYELYGQAFVGSNTFYQVVVKYDFSTPDNDAGEIPSTLKPER